MNIIDLGIWKAERSFKKPINYPKDAAEPADNTIWWRRESDDMDWKMFSMLFDPEKWPKWYVNENNLLPGKLLVTLNEIETDKWIAQGIFRDYTIIGLPTKRTKILLIDDIDPTNPSPWKLYEQKLFDEKNKIFVDYKPPVLSIKRHQGLLALLIGANITEQDIKNKIDLESDFTKKEITRIRFESPEWSRTSEFITWGMSQFNLSDEQINSLFNLAVTF